MTDEVQEITRELRRQLDRLDSLPLEGDWVDAWIDGDAIRTDEAAYIYGQSVQTIRRVADASAMTGRSIGKQVSKSVWLISRRRLLDWIEREKGLPARVEANARAEKWKNGSGVPETILD